VSADADEDPDGTSPDGTLFDEELELPGPDETRDTGLWDPEDDHVYLPEEEQAMHLEVEPDD
jgi:hypothetical protein